MDVEKTFIGIMIFAFIIWASAITFIAWIVIKLLQFFGVIA